jgi:two-component system, LytTR family, response regulator
MRKIKCIVIDDAALARSLIERHIAQITDFQLIKSCENAEEAAKVLQEENIDLIFCDIEMPKINGLDFIKTLEFMPVVIFTTAYSEYAIQGFDIGAIDYLLKPITFERFQIAATRAKERILSKPTIEKNDFIFVKSNGKQVKIIFEELLYIQSKGDYIMFCMTNKKVIVHERMKNIIQQLPDNQFIRIHHSYIVHIKKATAIHPNHVVIGEISLPVSEQKKEVLKDFLLL